MSDPQIVETNATQSVSTPVNKLQGRWKWALGILLIASVAQGSLWTLWWEDPTHFKMSILFVWPAALFALANWWIFFSGWSWRVRLGTVGAMVAALMGFFRTYRLEFDGDMVPRRLIFRSTPSAEEVARKYLRSQPEKSVDPSVASETNVDAAPVLIASAGDWTGFRGPHRDGVIQGASIRRDWTAKPPRQIWRHPIGRAWSAFAVVGNHAVTQEQRDEYECVVAYDAETGDQKWVHQDKAILSIVDANGGPGPHATPEFNDGLFYTQGGTGILNCLDAMTGRLVWTRNILQDAGDDKNPVKPPEWGISGSPLIVDDLVIAVPGVSSSESSANQPKGVIAYHKKTGEIVWAAGKFPASYSSPRLFTILDRRQILIPNAKGLSSHDVGDGHELWFYPLENGPKVNSAMPWLLEDRSVLFGTGYGIGSVRIELRQEGDHWTTTLGWESKRFRPKFNDFVVHDGYAFGLDDGTLSCLDVESGKVAWKSERCGYGQLLLVNDLLLIITEDGDLKLVPAVSKKPETLATFKVFDSGFCWNHIAFVRGRIYLRNANEAACFEIGDEQPGG